MNDTDLPSVQAAEQCDEVRRLLEASSLGDPEARQIVEKWRKRVQALPDRWMRLADLPHLLGLYQDRREMWGDTHDQAVAHVLGEVDYEPNQYDVDQGTYE